MSGPGSNEDAVGGPPSEDGVSGTRPSEDVVGGPRPNGDAVSGTRPNEDATGGPLSEDGVSGTRPSEDVVGGPRPNEDATGGPPDEQAVGGPRPSEGAVRGEAVPGAREAPPPLPGPGRRLWSARRVPAGVVALLVAAGAGLLLYDIAAVRAGRPAMRWRRFLARQLAERPLDDVWVLTGAGVTALLGLWLLVLAGTPGLRALLPMRSPHPDVRAGLRRDAAALLLRDRAMDVSGVRAARVRMRRRRADVRAVSHFRDLDDVHADLDAVLTDAVRGLGLARPPALRVRVRRPGRRD